MNLNSEIAHVCNNNSRLRSFLFLGSFFSLAHIRLVLFRLSKFTANRFGSGAGFCFTIYYPCVYIDENIIIIILCIHTLRLCRVDRVFNAHRKCSNTNIYFYLYLFSDIELKTRKRRRRNNTIYTYIYFYPYNIHNKTNNKTRNNETATTAYCNRTIDVIAKDTRGRTVPGRRQHHNQ